MFALLIRFLFLLNKNILIRNLFLLRYFCAVFLCYLRMPVVIHVFPAHVETLFFTNFIYTIKIKRVCSLSFTEQISRPKLVLLSCKAVASHRILTNRPIFKGSSVASHQTRSYNKKISIKGYHFLMTFHGLKITNWTGSAATLNMCSIRGSF